MPNFISEDDIEQAILRKLKQDFRFQLLNCYTADADDLNDRSGRADKNVGWVSPKGVTQRIDATSLVGLRCANPTRNQLNVRSGRADKCKAVFVERFKRTAHHYRNYRKGYARRSQLRDLEAT